MKKILIVLFSLLIACSFVAFAQEADTSTDGTITTTEQTTADAEIDGLEEVSEDEATEVEGGTHVSAADGVVNIEITGGSTTTTTETVSEVEVGTNGVGTNVTEGSSTSTTTESHKNDDGTVTTTQTTTTSETHTGSNGTTTTTTTTSMTWTTRW